MGNQETVATMYAIKWCQVPRGRLKNWFQLNHV